MRLMSLNVLVLVLVLVQAPVGCRLLGVADRA